MSSALVFLLFRSVVGRVTRMARRLREPRYAIGFLIGAAWSVFWLSRVFLGGGDFNVEFGLPPEALEQMSVPMARALQLVLALLLAFGLSVWWMVPLGGSSLELSEAELHLLLPAPVERRSLIQYAILRGQPGVLFGATIVTFFTGGIWPPGRGLLRLLGMWLFFTIWDLHSKGRGLWLARLREVRPAVAWRRRLILYAGILGFWLVMASALVALAASVTATLPADFDETREVIQGLVETHLDAAWNGTIGWMLTPLLLLLRPIFLELLDPGALGWLAAWLVPLAALGLHNEWVVRSQTRFEEAELAHARRRSRKTDPSARFWKLSERRRSWQPFRLRPSGRPETAIAWKNMMLVHRLPLRLLAAGLLATIALVVILARVAPAPDWMVGVLEMAGAMLLVFPPFFTGRSLRNDLRNDLLQLEALRAWPLRGWRVILAEIGAPVALTLLQMATGAVLMSALWLTEVSSAADPNRARAAIAGFLDVPPALAVPLVIVAWFPLGAAVALLTTCLENLAALAFPSWVHLGMSKKHAAAKFGQNLLIFFILSLALLAGLAPAAVAVGLVLLVQMFVIGVPFTGWELPLLGAVAALPVFIVVAGLVRAGGALWDRLDPSQELLEGRA